MGMDPSVPQVRVNPAYKKVDIDCSAESHGHFHWRCLAPVLELLQAWQELCLLRGAVGPVPQLWPQNQDRCLPIQGCGAFFLSTLGSLRFCFTEHPAGVKKQGVLPLMEGIAWASWEAAAAGSQSLPSSAVAPNSGMWIARPRFPMLRPNTVRDTAWQKRGQGTLQIVVFSAGFPQYWLQGTCDCDKIRKVKFNIINKLSLLSSLYW